MEFLILVDEDDDEDATADEDEGDEDDNGDMFCRQSYKLPWNIIFRSPLRQ